MKFTFAPETRPLEGYTLKRAIARGGFGEVYYALSDAGKEVAVKLIQNNLQVELRGVRQCLNLRHPHLVNLFDVRTDADGDHWVVMEYIAGKTLEEMLAEHPQGLPIEDILRWGRGISAALNYLHERALVHRDLKPGNLFWDDGNIKLGDVGLTKFLAPSQRSGQTQSVGTVYYMAPEVSHGKYGHEVDIYAFGVMLFEMLTGEVPFNGQTTGEILMKHLSVAPDLTRIAAPFRPVLSRALEKDPANRQSSALQLWKEFEAACQLTGTSHTPPPPLPPRHIEPAKHEIPTTIVTPPISPPLPKPSPAGNAITLPNWAEFVISCGWAGLLVALFSGGLSLISPLFGEKDIFSTDWNKAVSFASSLLFGTWWILLVGWLSSGNTLRPAHRRLWWAGGGILTGLLLHLVLDYLMVDSLKLNLRASIFFSHLGRLALHENGQPTPLGTAVFYSALFLLRRWGNLIDPQRPEAFSISQVFVSMVLGFGASLFLPFPTEWAVTWMAVASCVLQLSAPWRSPMSEK